MTRLSDCRSGFAVLVSASLVTILSFCGDARAQEGTNLIANGSFERWSPGRSKLPAEWYFRPWGRGDRVQLVTDPKGAHSGLRYVRLTCPSGRAKLDALPGGRGIKFVPGKTYSISVWARAEPGIEGAVLIVEPGRHRARLTSKWRNYTFTYAHPDDAKPLLGFNLGCRGGPIAIDDVSMTPEGSVPQWPKHIKADRRNLKKLPVQPGWRSRPDGRPFSMRVPVTVSEVMGVPVKKHLVKIKICDLMKSYSYEGLCPDSVVVVDGSVDKDGKTPSQLVDSESRIRGVSPQDELCFLIDLPPRSTKTYFVYLDLEEGKAGRQPLATELAKKFAKPSGYPHELDMEVDRPQDFQGRVRKKVTAFTVGLCLWYAPLVEKVLPDDEPRYERSRAGIAAANNETEAFQIFIETSRDVRGVALSATDLVRCDGKGRIAASNVSFSLVEEVTCPSIHPGLPEGPYPDVILPWRTRDLAAGKRRCALATVRVPRNTPGGEYRATITATGADGSRADLPLTLEVFDFELPERLTFKPVFWADNFGGAPRKGNVVTPQRRKLYDRNDPDGAVLELAKILAEYNGTSFYSHHDKCPYSVPWHWAPETGTAEFDFTRLDRNAKVLLEEYGQYYLCFGGWFRPAGRKVGAVWDWHRDIRKAMTYHHKMALPGHKHRLDTDEGKRMYRAYCRGIAEHLRKKGWLDRSYVYVCDETDRGAPSQAVAWCARAARKAGLKTFAASLAWGWPVYMSDIDAFTGIVSPKSLNRIRREGNEWWGEYNRPILTSYPLANARLLGADSFFKGASHYCTYFLYYPEVWIDSSDPSRVPANAGYRAGEFIQGRSTENSWFAWVYPFPSWELGKDDRPAPGYVPSLRLVALREGVEDYQYLKLLAEIGKPQPNDPPGGRVSRELLDQMLDLVERSARSDRLIHHKRAFFVVDPDRFYELRCKIGREIAKRLSSSGR